jgi:ribonuclease P/MRP protein subunit POP5
MKRVKRRYLALRLECDVLPTGREFVDAVWLAVTKLYGEVGASTSGLSIINFDPEDKIAVIRVSLAALSMVRPSLATVTVLAGRTASVHVLSVSGTLKALFESSRY